MTHSDLPTPREGATPGASPPAVGSRRERRPPNQNAAALAGWRSPLAVTTAGALLFTGLSGLWLYLAPFSIASQLLLLLHVVAGLAVVVPAVVYSVRHLQTWMAQKVTASMVLGYALLVLAAVALASGLVLTWQGAFGTRMSPSWDWVHLVTGLAVLALAMAHLAAAWLRRRVASRRDAQLSGAMASFAWRNAGILAAGAASVVLAAAVTPRQPLRFAPPPDYTLAEYSQQFEEFQGNPFAPTYARTDDLRLVAPELLAGSASCGSAGCHQDIYKEWLPSAHRFSAMNPPFQEVQREFAADRQPAETRYCAGCHDPISLFAGAKDIANQSLSAPGVDEGVSCVACHAISSVDVRGNADYVLTPPRRYLGEGTGGTGGWVGRFLIRTFPRQHLADYDRNLLRTPEFCGACHKQFIPEALNRFGHVEGQNQYDEWKNSHWNTGDPETTLTCRDCHMRMIHDSTDPGRGEAGDRWRSPDDGAHRDHRFIATNNFMPELLALEGWQEQMRLTEEWIRGETVIPEIAHLLPEGPVAGLELLAPETVEAGSEVTIRVVVTNRKAGHYLTTGPLDFIRAWVHLRAVDGRGEVLAEWGALDPVTRRILDEHGEEHGLGNARDEGTLVLQALPVDEHGELLLRHELWESAGGRGKRVIFAGYADSHRYRLALPPDVVGPVTLEAAFNYKRYRQDFLDLVLPGMEAQHGVRQPVVTKAEARHTLAVVAGGGDSPTPPESGAVVSPVLVSHPEEMRTESLAGGGP